MLTGNKLRDAVISAANNIANNRRKIDELNVFPVPDGDTGTNMSMTIQNASREVALMNDAGVNDVAKTCASALLRGARGNSGVILSLLFRGFAKTLAGKSEVNAGTLCEAISAGVDAAYKAVMKPTEGTILTVARVGSESAKRALANGADEAGVFAALLDGAKETLKKTPDLLPVLKKAGVVDAGGAGFIVILEGMRSVFEEGVIIGTAADEGVADRKKEKNAAAESSDEIRFPYCTEFIVRRSGEKDPAVLRAYLETVGDCVVVADDDDIIKVHVHTAHPGKVIEKALTFGALVNIKIENMRDQHERAAHDAAVEAEREKEGEQGVTSAPQDNEIGFVAVCAGEGVSSLFKDLSVDNIVSGGQTMNPSTDDILRAIEATPAKTVVVLPNNKNIIMASEQAVPLSTRKVIVLPTSTVPQGISAMLAFDPELSPEENAVAMQKAGENVQTGQITFAARDSSYDDKTIHRGELIAMGNGKISFLDSDLKHAVVKLTKSLVKKSTAFITLIYGEGVTDSQAEDIKNAVAAKVSEEIEISLVNGGQPVYYFMISVE